MYGKGLKNNRKWKIIIKLTSKNKNKMNIGKKMEHKMIQLSKNVKEI